MWLYPYQDRWVNQNDMRKNLHGLFSILMDSSNEMCNFCQKDMISSHRGWCLRDRTYAKLCADCFTVFDNGTFCHLYHQNENGWRKCASCDRHVHCGCVMSILTYKMNDLFGVTCMDCLERQSLVVSDVNASSEVPNPIDSSQLGKECGEDPNQATMEGLCEVDSQKSDIYFLFEKTLTPTDCKRKTGRLLVPKHYAEDFLLQPPGTQKMPLLVKDTEGTLWKFTLRWWLSKGNRKYVIDGMRKCSETMQWSVGDTLIFYRKHSDGSLVMELEKEDVNPSGSGTAVPEAKPSSSVSSTVAPKEKPSSAGSSIDALEAKPSSSGSGTAAPEGKPSSTESGTALSEEKPSSAGSGTAAPETKPSSSISGIAAPETKPSPAGSAIVAPETKP